MAARSIGSLTISFGLVAIPVKLYSATQSANAISFNLLHKGCGSRLRQQYVCQKDGTVVERDDMVKGYEFAKDQYVSFTADEIKALEEVGTHAVEISEFVAIDAIDPVYFDKTYYLAPDKGAAKPYALLTEALKETKRCAVARWATRGKAYIVVLRPVGDVLTMQQLHFATDVRPASEVDIAKPDVKPQELKLAKQIVEQQVGGGVRPGRVCRRRPHPDRSRNPAEGRRRGDLRVGSAAGERRQGHRPDGGAARQSRKDRIGEGIGVETRAAQGSEAGRGGDETGAQGEPAIGSVRFHERGTARADLQRPGGRADPAAAPQHGAQPDQGGVRQASAGCASARTAFRSRISSSCAPPAH